MKQTIILVHGVGLFGFEMTLLSRRLKKMGYDTRIFSYSAWGNTISEITEKLRVFLLPLEDRSLHFVGHSLGGLVIMKLLEDYPELKTGRIITMGTPHNDCIGAKRTIAIPLGKYIIGKGLISVLNDKFPPVPKNKDIGAIAGNLNLILGWFLGIPRPNDTVIAVDEVNHPNLTDFIVVPSSHAFLVTSKYVVEQIDCFIKNGQFK